MDNLAINLIQWKHNAFSYSIFYDINTIKCIKNNCLLLLQAICLYYIGISSFCFDNIFCIMAVHLAGQFRILRYRLMTLCDTEPEKDSRSTFAKQVYKFYEQFKKCVRYHQALIDYYQNLENVYTIITLGQVLVFSVLICLFGYQVFVVSYVILLSTIP